MVSRLSCLVLAACVAAGSNLSFADSIYMQSTADGSISFNRLPAMPRFSAYTESMRRAKPARRARLGESGGACPQAACDRISLDRLINDVAQGYGVESALLHAIIAVESRYDPKAVSPDGAGGLMQLMPLTAKRYGVENVLDPEQNLRGGARYLKDLLTLFSNDLRLVIAAYQAGEAAVMKYRNSIPPFPTTAEYVSKVLANYHRNRSGAAG